MTTVGSRTLVLPTGCIGAGGGGGSGGVDRLGRWAAVGGMSGSLSPDDEAEIAAGSRVAK